MVIVHGIGLNFELRKVLFGIILTIVTLLMTSGIGFTEDTNMSTKSPEANSPIEPSLDIKKVPEDKLSLGKAVLVFTLMEVGIAAVSSLGYLDHGANILGWIDLLSAPLCLTTNFPEQYSDKAVATGVISCAIGFAGLGVYNFTLDRQHVSKDTVFLSNFLGINLVALFAAASGEIANSLSKKEILNMGVYVHPNEVNFRLVMNW